MEGLPFMEPCSPNSSSSRTRTINLIEEELEVANVVLPAISPPPLIPLPLPLVQRQSSPRSPIPDHEGPVGGRLTHFQQGWKSVTTDLWVLNLVENGYALPFREFPPPYPPCQGHCSQDHLLLLQEEVLTLLQKGAIEVVPEQERGLGCYSRYFLIPKKDGRLLPILDLRILNWYLKQEKFKMLTLAQVLLALQEEDWMVSIDLQDAYFHIPILKSHRKYLRFMVGSQHYQFAVLPVGLTTALRVFTKVMAVVAAHLRRSGIPVVPYLDDWLIKAKSPEMVQHHLQVTSQLLFDLGFSINVPKSHLEPSQRNLFIGAVLDTTVCRAFPPPQRILDIQEMIPLFHNGAAVPVLKVLRLLGLFASCILLVSHARWHIRALHWCLHRPWFQRNGDLRESITISRDTAADLSCWSVESNLTQGKPFHLREPQ